MKRILLLWLIAVTVYAQSEYVSLSSDEIFFSEKERLLHASSNVVLIVNDIEIQAPFLTLNVDTQEAWTTASVQIRRGEELFYSNSLHIDLEKEEVELTDIKLTIQPPENKGHMYIRTKKLIDNKDVKRGFSGLITTCDDPDPHYYLWAHYYRYYPDKQIMMFNVFIYNKILFIPVGVWVPFYYYALGEREVVWNFPTIGKREKEGWGWFVQNQIDYKYKNNKDSSLLIDWYQYKGLGYGINHHYDFWENHSGNIYAYNFDFTDENDRSDPNKNNTIYRVKHTYEPNDATTIKTSYLKSDVDEKINSSGSDKREERSIDVSYDDLGDIFTFSMDEKDNLRQERKTQSLSINRSFNRFKVFEFDMDKNLNYTTSKELQTYKGEYNHKISKNLVLENNFTLKRNNQWQDSIAFDERLYNDHTLIYKPDSHITFKVHIDTMKDLDESDVTDDISSGLINDYFYKLPEIELQNRNRTIAGFTSDQTYRVARYQEAKYDSSTGIRRIFPSNEDFSVAPNTFYMKQGLKRTFDDLKLDGRFTIGSTYEQYTFFIPDTDAFAGDAAYKLSFTAQYNVGLTSFLNSKTSYSSAYSPVENNSPFYYFDRSLQSESNQIKQSLVLYYLSESDYKWENSAGYNYIKDEWTDYFTEVGINPNNHYSFKLKTGKKIDPDETDYARRWHNLQLTNRIINIWNHVNVTHYISLDLNKIIDDDYTHVTRSNIDWSFYIGRDKEYRWEIVAKQSYNTRNQNEDSTFQTRKYELKTLGIRKHEHKRMLELNYTSSSEQWDIIYTILAFPDDPIEIRKKKDIWTIEGRLKENTKERFQ